MLSAMKESRPDVGSSMKRRGGSINISVATDNLFLSPPELQCLQKCLTTLSYQLKLTAARLKKGTAQ